MIYWVWNSLYTIFVRWVPPIFCNWIKYAPLIMSRWSVIGRHPSSPNVDVLEGIHLILILLWQTDIEWIEAYLWFVWRFQTTPHLKLFNDLSQKIWSSHQRFLNMFQYVNIPHFKAEIKDFFKRNIFTKFGQNMEQHLIFYIGEL